MRRLFLVLPVQQGMGVTCVAKNNTDKRVMSVLFIFSFCTVSSGSILFQCCFVLGKLACDHGIDRGLMLDQSAAR